MGTQLHPYFFALLALAACLHCVSQARIEALGDHFRRLPAPVQGATYAAAILLLCGATIDSPSFIYFQF